MNETAERIAKSCVIGSYKFLNIAIAFGSPSINYYKKRHRFYLDNYKKVTGEDFIFPKGVKPLI